MSINDDIDYRPISAPSPKKATAKQIAALKKLTEGDMAPPVPHDEVVIERPPRKRAARTVVVDEEEKPTGSVTMFNPVLALYADVVGDLERVRIATSNRVGTMTRSEPDEDGIVRGWGLPETDPKVTSLVDLLEGLQDLETGAIKDLQREMRKHPMWTNFGKHIRGVGEKQLARLLGAIGGDPYINNNTGGPRTVSQLWAYCGLHVVQVPKKKDSESSDSQDLIDTPIAVAVGTQGGGADSATELPITEPDVEMVSVAPRRRRGIKANWSNEAKTRAYLISASILKQLVKPCTAEFGHVEECKCSTYRVVYDGRREHTKVTHPEWTPGHAHNDALRFTSKRLLRNAWRSARDWHLEQQGKEPINELD